MRLTYSKKWTFSVSLPRSRMFMRLIKKLNSSESQKNCSHRLESGKKQHNTTSQNKHSENLAFQHECSSLFQGIAAGKEQLTTAHSSLYRSLRDYLNCTVIFKESPTQRTWIPNSLTLHSFKAWIAWPQMWRCICWLQLQIFLSAFFNSCNIQINVQVAKRAQLATMLRLFGRSFMLKRTIFFGQLISSLYKTNRFHVAVRLFSKWNTTIRLWARDFYHA